MKFTSLLCREYLDSDEYKKLIAERQAAQLVPERIPKHEENEWNIELLSEAQHDKASPVELEVATESVDVSDLAVSDMIAKLEATQM